jgi:aarF domain-containing kinase
LFFSNRGIFIKVGQHIAALNNIIPPEYTETMKKCQDQSISDSFENIKRLVELELKDKIENMFLYFF